MGFLFSRGHNTTNRADMIGDFQINTASYGEVVPEVLGTTRLSGNIIYYDDFTPMNTKPQHELARVVAQSILK